MTLDLSYRRLTSLDGIDLTGVTHLDCYDNQLMSLPSLPSTLKILQCGNNQLTSLPPLPASLKKLYCYNNRLTSLPPLPASLEILYCWNNQLTEYPDLPWGLKDWDKEKLAQHNKKCADLGMECVKTLPNKEIWDEVAEKHLIWQYRLGGEKWSKACSSLVEK